MGALRLIKNTLEKKCDFGNCMCRADFCIKFENCGGGANIDVCKDCLNRLVRQSKRLTNEK